MPQAARRYRTAVRYLQHKTSTLQALTRAEQNLKAAYAAVTDGDPSIGLLEDLRADVELALREARGMANMDDAALTGSGPAA